MASCRAGCCCGWVASYGVGIEATRLATRWHLPRGATCFWAALTVMASSRAREGRSGADSRALGSLQPAPAFSFLIFFFDFGFDFHPDRWCFRWGVPPALTLMASCRAGCCCGRVASYGVGIEATRLATRWH